MEENYQFHHLYWDDFKKKLMFARDNGCNTLMLTGDGEPLMNREFLEKFGHINNGLLTPFRWIELQTSGVFLDEAYLRFLRNHVGVSVISLSVSSLNSKENIMQNQIPEQLQFHLPYKIDNIKKYDFTLRLSLNLTDALADDSAKEILEEAKELGADQVTFRQLYKSGIGSKEDKWIDEHRASDEKLDEIRKYIIDNGEPMSILPFGATKYSIHDMSVVLDDDCMAEEVKDTYKYLILRPDAKLYSSWDKKESVLF
jgi:MoaA/NifB/PqqE/SkfB family radical SAM enzyme